MPKLIEPGVPPITLSDAEVQNLIEEEAIERCYIRESDGEPDEMCSAFAGAGRCGEYHLTEWFLNGRHKCGMMLAIRDVAAILGRPVFRVVDVQVL